VVLVRILLPQGILWDDDGWTGKSESVDTITKFRSSGRYHVDRAQGRSPVMTPSSVSARTIAVRRPPRDRVLTYVVLAALLIVVVAWNGNKAREMVSLLDFGDFRIFHHAAESYLAGGGMYPMYRLTVVVGGGTATFERPNLNPPHFHLLLLPLALLPVGAALMVWGAASVVSLLLCLRLIVSESGLTLTPLLAMRGAVWLLAFCGNSAVISTTQVSLLLLLPVTLAWMAARRGAWSRAGVWLGVAISLKLFLLIFLPYLLLRRRVAASASAYLTALACFGLGLAVFGVQSHREWLALLVGADWAWTPMNASLLSLLSRLLAVGPVFAPLVTAPDLVRPLWAALAGAVGLATLIVVAKDETEASVDRSFALLLLAALLISPLGWLYYLWLALGPITVLASRWWGDPGRSRPDLAARARWLLWLVAPGFFLPTFLTVAFQPSRWATLLLGSLHSWAVLLLWTALVIDATAAAPASASRGELTCAGRATGLRGAR
jgi:hypothetical protein